MVFDWCHPRIQQPKRASHKRQAPKEMIWIYASGECINFRET
jgi:hypothetical protein